MGTRTGLWPAQPGTGPGTGCVTWSQTLNSLNVTLLTCDAKTPNLTLQPYCNDYMAGIYKALTMGPAQSKH